MSDAYGELFEINEAGTTVNIPVAGTFVKWTTSSAGLGGPSDLIDVDAANDQLVVGANGGGVYEVIVSTSMEGNNNSLKEGAVFLNGVRQQQLEFNRHIGNNVDEGAAGISGLITLVAGDVIDLRFT
ncbi:hypothetical protein LCGC14_2324410, partial [marine sediment metagenome]